MNTCIIIVSLHTCVTVAAENMDVHVCIRIYLCSTHTTHLSHLHLRHSGVVRPLFLLQNLDSLTELRNFIISCAESANLRLKTHADIKKITKRGVEPCFVLYNVYTLYNVQFTCEQAYIVALLCILGFVPKLLSCKSRSRQLGFFL